MLSTLSTLSLLILSTSAMPWGPSHSSGSGSKYGNGGSSSQTPFKFPLQNGFPNIQPNSAALTAIQKQAHGTLPNTPLPSSLADASATTFQAIAFGEFFEVAYFSSLIQNITDNVPQYEVGSGAVRNVVLNALLAIQAQEELHAIGVNGILQTAGRTTVQPCQYIFPVDSFDDAIYTAVAFTDAVVLGGLQDALLTFATDGDTAVVPLLTSVVGQEGQQSGFYRNLEGNVPAALPFLTRSTGPFAYSYINQNFVVPGTCPTQIQVPIFNPLYLQTSNIAANDQQLQFQFSTQQAQIATQPAQSSANGLSLVYINQQNAPIVQQLSNVQTNGNTISFSANFPYNENLMNGLTIAVVVQGSGPFSDADAVANATVYGPAIIEVN